ncbi:ABC transporter permease [Paenibacillus mendelii]|uniref:ABC transporter permease n=1 Tax=Paenibacillus mendelii TaxID=206163 RepID=A0ABV6J363_9BACL|nr:ABC transporter permease subunit [Paenibacillus mendelii]MCQ6559427.1 ABC transporter permease subunit [Paenibacillus mendelii]
MVQQQATSRWKRQWPLYAMLVPAIICVVIYSYIPLVGSVIAFQDFTPFKGWFGSDWVGLDQFRYAFELPDIWKIIRNTVVISLMKIVAGLFVPILFALLLNEINKMFVKRSIQTLIYLPHFLSWVILGGILIDILSPSEGMVNQLIKWLGFEPVFFLGDNRWFPYILVLTDTWKEFGFSTIVYLAALTGINPALYEAAVIDGAGRIKQTWHITLPGMIPIIVLMATLSLGNVLNAGFDQVFNLYSPQVYESGDVLDTLIYRVGLEDMQYSVATALGLVKSVVSFAFISISYWLAYRLANYRIF